MNQSWYASAERDTSNIEKFQNNMKHKNTEFYSTVQHNMKQNLNWNMGHRDREI